ncbi:MAG TPA: hypothetical protein VK564_03755 [Thermodesulfobacteriota bacterium]|nr:hypothetical protein [Thermodesulfobacteriota bacterium]
MENYPWCGHGVLIGQQANEWQERDFILEFLGSKGKKAIRAYREFVEAGMVLGQRPELTGGGLIRSLGGWSKVVSLRKKGESEASDERILGGGEFVQAILREADQKLVRQIKAKKIAGEMSKILKEKCHEAGVKEAELRSGSQRRTVTELRRELCYYLYRDLGIPMAEIARHVGVGTTGVAMAIKRMEGAFNSE